MSKDPAFLFYSKDWIEGTAEMMPDEKGVYIDLLCHQHQHGAIPSDISRLSRIVRLTEADFLLIWDHVKSKFEATEDGKLKNRKLGSVMSDRADKGHKNKIIGVFASLLRKYDLDKAEYNEVKKLFKVDAFLPFSTVEATERLTEWFTEWYDKRSKSIGNGNANANEDSTKKEEKLPPPEFVKAWNDYVEMRKKIKKPMTKRAEELAKGELRKLAGKDVSLAIKILEQSTFNSWQGLFELKGNGKEQPKTESISKLNYENGN